jgi:uncharacterized protein
MILLEKLGLSPPGKADIARVQKDKRLVAVEHHHYKIGERWFLFNVNALEVVPSVPEDRVVLAAANAGASRAELEAAAQLAGLTAKIAKQRVRNLMKHGFLVASGTPLQLAKSGHLTNYATFMVNVSQRCNLTCPYCYVAKGHFDYIEKPIPKMRTETADLLVGRLYDLFPGLGTYGYHFYGGEPLLNFSAIEKIVAVAEETAKATGTNADFHITTNGTLLTRDIADFMDRHRFTVFFSIDGNEEQHDELRKYIRGGGSYRDVERNLAYLRTKPGVHLIGSTVIRKGVRLGEALKKLQAHGASQCKAERVRLKDDDGLALSGEQHASYLSDIESLVDHYTECLQQARKPMDFRLSSKILQMLTRTRREFFCPAGERMFGVAANGEIYPCALHVGRPQSKLGDVATGIDPELQKNFRKRFSPQEQKDCKTCWTRHLCGGGCSAMVDRFGHEDCASLRAESEAAIAVYQHFAETDPVRLLGLVSPKVVQWMDGALDDPQALMPTEPAALRVRPEHHGDETRGPH